MDSVVSEERRRNKALQELIECLSLKVDAELQCSKTMERIACTYVQGFGDE